MRCDYLISPAPHLVLCGFSAVQMDAPLPTCSCNSQRLVFHVLRSLRWFGHCLRLRLPRRRETEDASPRLDGGQYWRRTEHSREVGPLPNENGLLRIMRAFSRGIVKLLVLFR